MNLIQLLEFISDKTVTWYGPHQCNGCGEIIITSSVGTGGVKLNAGAHEHHYPNFEWTQHKCANLATNGRKGGSKSKRILTPEQAKGMVKARELKKEADAMELVIERGNPHSSQQNR